MEMSRNQSKKKERKEKNISVSRWQPKMIKDHWAKLGKGVTCATSGTDGCEKLERNQVLV